MTSPTKLSIRAILCCMDIRKVMFKLDLVARFGVTTGRNYCGVVGYSSKKCIVL